MIRRAYFQKSFPYTRLSEFVVDRPLAEETFRDLLTVDGRKLDPLAPGSEQQKMVTYERAA
jgi:hypothetical protein